MSRASSIPSRPAADSDSAARRGLDWFEPSLEAIFDKSSDGILVVNVSGNRVYSNPALDDLIGDDACRPFATSEPPPYVPTDQRQKYQHLMEGMASLLSVEGSGEATTTLEILTQGQGRVRTDLTMIAMTSAGKGRFAVCILKPEAAAMSIPVGRLDGRSSSDNAAEMDLAPLSGLEALTRREQDVLGLLLDGRRVSSIARSLYLSEHTVRNHLKAIFRKLGAHSQTELLDRFRPLAGTRPPGRPTPPSARPLDDRPQLPASHFDTPGPQRRAAS